MLEHQALMAALQADERFQRLASAVTFRARRKSLYSIMKKMLRLGDTAAGGRRLDEVYDLLGVRAVVAPRDDLPEAEAEAAAAEACYIVQVGAERLCVAFRCAAWLRLSWVIECMAYGSTRSKTYAAFPLSSCDLSSNVFNPASVMCPVIRVSGSRLRAVALHRRPHQRLHPQAQSQRLPEPAPHAAPAGGGAAAAAADGGGGLQQR